MQQKSAVESEFWRSGQYLRLLVENADDYAIISLGLDGRITSWNPGAEQLLGWTAEEAIGQPSAIFFTEEDRSRGLHERERAEAADEGRVEDTRWHLRKSGERFWANGVMIAVESEDGQLVGFAKIFRDLTGQKQHEEALEAANAQLEQSNRNLEAFAGYVVHEVRSSLMGFRLHLDLLFRKHADVLDAETLELAKTARESLHDLDRFAVDLLAYARLGGPAERAYESIESEKVFREALSDLRPQVERCHAQITVGNLPQVYADPTQLRHLFRNLIDNAIKYNDADVPRIEIDAERGTDAWLFRVHDNGIGISEVDREHIFAPFWHDAKEGQFGAGVGLSLCKRIVEQHGGDIWVESEPQQGSTFLFTLPNRRKGTEGGARQQG